LNWDLGFRLSRSDRRQARENTAK